MVIKIKLNPVWTYNIGNSFPDCYGSRLSLDSSKKQAIISTRSIDEEPKEKNGVVSVNLGNGTLAWKHILKHKQTAVWQTSLDKKSIVILAEYTGESDHHYPQFPYSLSLDNGSPLWNYHVEATDPLDTYGEELQALNGISNDVLVGRNNDYKLTGIDVKTGKRIWELKKSSALIKRTNVYVPLNDVVVLQTGERKLGWVSPSSGKLVSELELDFPVNKKGFIDGIWYQDDSDDILVSIYDSERDYKNPIRPKTIWEYSMIYAINKQSKKSKLVAKIEGRCESIVKSHENLYISTKDRCYMLKGKKVAPKLLGEYAVISVLDKKAGTLLCQNTLERFADRHILSVRDLDGNAKWESSKNHQLLLQVDKHLFVLEEEKQDGNRRNESLVVVKKQDGKEITRTENPSIREIVPLDNNQVLILRNKDVTKLRLG